MRKVVILCSRKFMHASIYLPLHKAFTRVKCATTSDLIAFLHFNQSESAFSRWTLNQLIYPEILEIYFSPHQARSEMLLAVFSCGGVCNRILDKWIRCWQKKFLHTKTRCSTPIWHSSFEDFFFRQHDAAKALSKPNLIKIYLTEFYVWTRMVIRTAGAHVCTS